jgi:DNA-directed RNA polymerase subunit RPC12/RpoP
MEADQVGSASDFLIRNLPWAADRRWDFREFSNEVTRLVEECKRALDPQDLAEPKRVSVGKCPQCGKRLFAKLGTTRIECSTCNTGWGMGEWSDLAS